MMRRWLRLALPPAATLTLCLAGLALLSTRVPNAARAAGARPAALEPASPSAASTSLSFTLSLTPLVTTGLTDPVFLAHAGDGSGRLFVVERAGRIRVIKNGALLGPSFLNITTLVESGGSEQGLLSVAFDPDYESNGAFYVNYTARAGSGDTSVARYVVSNPASDAPGVISTTTVLVIDQPQSNHNGGQLQFGPNDGYLYIGMGDGGSAGDSGSGHHEPGGNAQWPGTLLGKLLRVDVRGVPTYTIPASNPFTQTAGARPEIWALGVRNPWRFSFDRLTGDVYIGDVGQGAWEEVSVQPGSSAGGENYGWRCKEGFNDFNFSGNCPNLALTPPAVAYPHSVGPGIEGNCSITGGYVYRGSAYPWLQGVYFYADYCSGRIWALQQTGPGAWANAEKSNHPFLISSFGEDEAGELYVLDYSGGDVYRLTSTAAPEVSTSAKSVSDPAPAPGSLVVYTIVLRNTGGAFTHTVRLTDVVPGGLTYKPGTLAASSGVVDASSAPTLKWSGMMSSLPVVTVTYAATVTEMATRAITNVATIDPGFDAPFTRSASVVVNGPKLYLPLVLKDD